MKRLFVVSDARNKAYKVKSDVVYFDNKMTAKGVRDLLNEELGGNAYHIANGPDHMGRHGHLGVPRMRRQPK